MVGSGSWQRWRGVVAVGIMALFGIAAGCQSTPGGSARIAAIKPASPPPNAATLRPGLAVEYLNMGANSVVDVEIAGRGKPGKPLPHLNWRASSSPVMTSPLTRQVAARIAGFMQFPSPGTYVMQIKSNDGVRLSIDGVTVIEDPTVHPDRLSDPVSLTIKKAGWYKLFMLYFQKEGAATLELYWQRPNSTKFEIVPGTVFAH